MLRNALVIISKFALVLAFLYGLFGSFLFWAGYIGAKSSDCIEGADSFFSCNPSDYLVSAIFASIITTILFISIILIARKELKDKKAK